MNNSHVSSCGIRLSKGYQSRVPTRVLRGSYSSPMQVAYVAVVLPLRVQN
jgi:hypothetical protein